MGTVQVEADETRLSLLSLRLPMADVRGWMAEGAVVHLRVNWPGRVKVLPVELAAVADEIQAEKDRASGSLPNVGRGGGLTPDP